MSRYVKPVADLPNGGTIVMPATTAPLLREVEAVAKGGPISEDRGWAALGHRGNPALITQSRDQ